MQFYLLLLSGLISDSTVLAQVVTGYDDPGCNGNIIFTETPVCTPACTDITPPDTESVNLPLGVRCELYADPDCTGQSELFENYGCNAVTLDSVDSVKCFKDVGC
jgi:hypothetical protein